MNNASDLFAYNHNGNRRIRDKVLPYSPGSPGGRASCSTTRTDGQDQAR
jgi:hypothetical protein